MYYLTLRITFAVGDQACDSACSISHWTPGLGIFLYYYIVDSHKGNIHTCHIFLGPFWDFGGIFLGQMPP